MSAHPAFILHRIEHKLSRAHKQSIKNQLNANQAGNFETTNGDNSWRRHTEKAQNATAIAALHCAVQQQL